MNKDFFFLYLILVLFLSSCATKKNVLYLQDSDENNIVEYNYVDNYIQNDDILDIKVFSLDSDLSSLYNQSSNNERAISDLKVIRIRGYLVNNDGNINFPGIGEINVSGKTTEELELFIYKKLLDTGLLINHSVKVKIINSKITVLGEVNSPGTYDFFENNININEALGLAGDLTITAERKKLKLIRENTDGKIEINNIDLTSMNYINSDLYQLKSGDIIIVSPNITKVKSSGIIGNSGTLISLLSFILTSIILITN